MSINHVFFPSAGDVFSTRFFLGDFPGVDYFDSKKQVIERLGDLTETTWDSYLKSSTNNSILVVQSARTAGTDMKTCDML